jgi:VWFA-related protein
MRNGPTKIPWTPWLVAAWALLAGTGAGAQEKAELLPVYIERVEVNLVNVEVVATRKGKPVTGLTREDFEIWDDDQQVEITNFYAVDGGRRLADVEPPEPREEKAEAEAEVAVALQPERNFVIILIDNAFISPPARAKIFAALRGRLDDLLFTGAQVTQVMVVSKDREIKFEQRFTTDREEIEAALDRIEKLTSTGSLHGAEQRMVVSQIAVGASPNPNPGFGVDTGVTDAQMTMSQIHNHAEFTVQMVRRSALVLNSFMSSLAGLPGRKAILYVSDGLPLRAGEFLFQVWFNKYSVYADEVGIFSAQEGAAEYDATNEVVNLIADASANRVAFYPVSSGASPILEAASARSAGIGMTASQAVLTESNPVQGLRLLARSTGGVASTELASLDGLVDQMQADLTSYYSLGYPSPHGGDGKAHDIKVKVKRDGVQLRYLETYRDKDPDQRMNDRTLSAIMLESGENPLDVRVEVGEMIQEKKDRFLVPVEVKFPLAKLTLVPEEKVHVGSVSIFVIVRDEQGRISDPQKVPIPVRIPNENLLAAMSQNAAYATKIRLRAGNQTIGVGVRDDISSVGSVVNVPIQVGER